MLVLVCLTALGHWSDITSESAFLTPTMKIKRDLIEEKYETVVAAPADSKVVFF